jgi:putative redox protein
MNDCVAVDETLLGRFQVLTRTASAPIVGDEPVAVGGLGSGPNPYEIVCSALGSCAVMTMRVYAAHKQWPLSRARVVVVHRRLDDGRAFFEKYIELEGPLDQDQRARILAIADKCPVHKLLEQGAIIRSRLADGSLPAISTSDNHTRDVVAACMVPR